MWLSIFCALSAILSLACAIAATVSAQRAVAALASVRTRLSSLESTQSLQTISMQKWQEVTEEVARSLKFQKIRRGIRTSGHDGDGPDPREDPEAWRAWMNGKLRAEKFRG